MGQERKEMKFKVHTTTVDDLIPCQRACPVHTDAGRYVQLISEGRPLEGYLVARNSNPLVEICGQVCAAPCEDHCRRGKIDTSVTIRGLKRFLNERFTDSYYQPADFLPEMSKVVDELEANVVEHHLSHLPRGEKSGKRVVVVGAGPAGLGCAHDLLLMGHEVTIMEAADHFGGALKISIPMYRLGRDYIERLAHVVEALGGKIVYNAPLTAETGVSGLLADYDAVFLGVGAMVGQPLSIPGGDAKGVMTSLTFLRFVNMGQLEKLELGEKVVVIGGGRVALDAVRTSRRMYNERGYSGAMDTVRSTIRMGEEHRDISICYRRSIEEMPSHKTIQGREELEETVREGIPIFEHLWPERINTRDGRVCEMVFRKKRSADEEGEEVVMPADNVIVAVGQSPDLSFLREEDGVKITDWGTIAFDEETMATSREGVYTAGDAALGPATLIEAAGGGKKAASQIDDYLRGNEKKTSLSVHVTEIPKEVYHEMVDYGRVGREPPPTKDVEERKGFGMVEESYDEADAAQQADRCLNCHIQTVYAPSLCTLCGRCVDHCPNDCLRFVSAAMIEGHETSGAAALIKDEDKCIRCGLCARRCPTRAMQMERVSFQRTFKHTG